MIMPSDRDYQQTKQVKTRGTPLPSPYRELADWIDTHYNVRVLNIIVDAISPDNRPRLNVVLEFHADAERFRQKPGPNYDEAAQHAVRTKILSLTNDFGARGSTLLVILSSFEAVARIEANQQVTASDILQLMGRIGDSELWKVRPSFDLVTFFYFTDAQLRAHRDAGVQDADALEYARTIEPYDQFGYLQKNPISVRLDSKQNFDAHFSSNWFCYDR